MNAAPKVPPADATSTGEARLRGGALVRWAVGVALGAVLLLAVAAPRYGPGQLHVQDMYVDQLGYVTSARILVDTGELRNGVLMPSQIENPRFRPYMPGHYLALAASYLVLGYGVFATLLPSLASYVLVAVGVFVVGNRLYGRAAGVLAAALFALYPATITYAFTAMAELTFTLAGVAALVVLVHLPPRARPAALPLLLTLPFLFRESGAFLVLPLGALVLQARGLVAAGGAAAGSVGVLWLVNRWQIADGKLAASLAFVTQGRFNYYNAYPKPEPELSTRELLAALGDNVERNLDTLGALLRDWPGELMPVGLLVLLVAAPPLLVAGARAVRRDPFPLGAALLLGLVLTLTVTLYDTQAHKMMRTALFTWPFVALAAAGLVRPDQRLAALPAPGRRRALAGAAVALALTLAASYAVCVRAGERMTRNDYGMATMSRRLAEIHDPDTLIVGPPPVAPWYPIEHYPVLWCFTIAGARTYAAIKERYVVGTLLSRERLPPQIVGFLELQPYKVWGSPESPVYVYVRKKP